MTSRLPPPSLSELAAQAIDLIQSGKPRLAARILKDVLKADPGNFDALQATAALHAMDHQYTEAARLLNLALKRDPNFVPALLSLGTAELMSNRPAEAEAAVARAVALDPQNPQAHLLLGQSRQAQGKLAEAAASYTRTATLDPGNALALSSAVGIKQKSCDWAGIEPLEQALIATLKTGQAGGHAGGFAVEPLLMQHISDDPALHRLSSQRYWRDTVMAGVPPTKRTKPNQHKPRNRPRIRLGYLSVDLRQHAVACLIAELFELHDRSRLEVYGFSYGQDDKSAMRQRLSKAFDRFIDVRETTDEQFAARIASAEIDIAIDLTGYTEGARLAVLARRPAPLQCHFLGFPGTIGSDAVDYLFADHVVAPPGAEQHYTERLVRLPDSYQVNDRKRAVADSGPGRKEYGLPEDGVVFCSFNGQQKLSSRTLDIWVRVLAAVPGSVLWLYTDLPLAAANLRKEVAARGLDPARLIIAEKVPPAQHLARLRLADLFLDSLPYGAHTTGSDALWVGLPVLTCPGQAFAGRVGASLLTAVGMPELIATDIADYEAKAIALAREPARLADLRRRLIAGRDTAALFDTDRFRRNIEAAYTQMWARWQQGLPPAHIDLRA